METQISTSQFIGAILLAVFFTLCILNPMIPSWPIRAIVKLFGRDIPPEK